MKKLVLSFSIISVVGLTQVQAQCVANGTNTDTIPHAYVGQAYSTVIQLKVPNDTMIDGVSATIDSIDITSVGGLPSGFTDVTNPASGHFPGGSNGCVLLSGSAPTVGMEGTDTIKAYITVYGKVFGSTPASLNDSIAYILHIDGPAGVVNLSTNKFDLSQNFPDPANNLTNIYYSVPYGTNLDFKIYNLLGTVVYQKSFFAEGGTGTIALNAKDFAPGIYMYNLSNGKSTLTKRMVMANN